MSIFKDLLDLNPNKIPLEDFFTEIFTYIIKSDGSLLSKWLNHFAISNLKFDEFYVSTQESFDALDTHVSGSRPDIFVELSNNLENELIFVECKIGSEEGDHQLQRYAEHLDGIEHINKRTLVYITRDFDSKSQSYIFENCKNVNDLTFVQLRWHQVYQFLLEYNEVSNNLLITEALIFMEENSLSGSNRFTSIDILAITNFPRVRRMMEETMSGQVADRFESIAGGTNTKHSSALNQVRDHERYVYLQEQADKIEIILGYSMNSSKLGSYPEVGLSINVNPNADERDKTLKVLREVVSNSNKWEGYNLTGAKKWAGIFQSKSLDCFLNQEDHIVAIQNYFLGLLYDLESIKDEYNDLKWLVSSTQ